MANMTSTNSGKFKQFVSELFTFNGRVARGRYWLNFMGIYMVLCILLLALIMPVVIIWGLVSPETLSQYGYYLTPLAIPLVILYLTLLSFNNCKRLHDLGQPGLYWILYFIPGVNSFFCLYVWIFKGVSGPNKYGDDPLR